jgi:hypothetical protein
VRERKYRERENREREKNRKKTDRGERERERENGDSFRLLWLTSEFPFFVVMVSSNPKLKIK